MFMKVQVSSTWKKKNLTRKTVGFETTTQMVQYATLTTRPLRICWKRRNNLSTYSIKPNPQKRPKQFRNSA